MSEFPVVSIFSGDTFDANHCWKWSGETGSLVYLTRIFTAEIGSRYQPARQGTIGSVGIEQEVQSIEGPAC